MSTERTSEVIHRFNDAFQRHDGSVFADLVADDCVIENTTPAPDGARHEGGAACVEHWRGIATAPDIRFDLEDVIVKDEQAIILWKLHRGASESIRGVNLMWVRDGRIVKAMGYVKGQ